MEKNKKLIAVSGGVDSMFLLNEYKNQNIVAAFVNYNIRKDVDIDQKIVSDFCKKYNITLEILSINEKYIGNFQEWARNKRYCFFEEVYSKYNCNELLVAQHKDDFLESAIMQWRSKRKPYLFGISKNINLFGMNISRPIIFKYWKSEIYELANIFEISFNDDYTNFTNNYTRNKLRNELKEISITTKEILFNSFNKINVQNSIKKIRIIKKYYEWSQKKFNIDFLEENKNYLNELIFKYIINHFKDQKININKNIINSIYAYLIGKNSDKFFLLSNKQMIGKNNNNIIKI